MRRRADGGRRRPATTNRGGSIAFDTRALGMKNAMGDQSANRSQSAQGVDIAQHVQVERRGHTQRIVVGKIEQRFVFDEICPEQQMAVITTSFTRALQECERCIGCEVADR